MNSRPNSAQNSEEGFKEEQQTSPSRKMEPLITHSTRQKIKPRPEQQEDNKTILSQKSDLKLPIIQRSYDSIQTSSNFPLLKDTLVSPKYLPPSQQQLLRLFEEFRDAKIKETYSDLEILEKKVFKLVEDDSIQAKVNQKKNTKETNEILTEHVTIRQNTNLISLAENPIPSLVNKEQVVSYTETSTPKVGDPSKIAQVLIDGSLCTGMPVSLESNGTNPYRYLSVLGESSKWKPIMKNTKPDITADSSEAWAFIPSESKPKMFYLLNLLSKRFFYSNKESAMLDDKKIGDEKFLWRIKYFPETKIYQIFQDEVEEKILLIDGRNEFSEIDPLVESQKLNDKVYGARQWKISVLQIKNYEFIEGINHPVISLISSKGELKPAPMTLASEQIMTVDEDTKNSTMTKSFTFNEEQEITITQTSEDGKSDKKPPWYSIFDGWPRNIANSLWQTLPPSSVGLKVQLGAKDLTVQWDIKDIKKELYEIWWTASYVQKFNITSSATLKSERAGSYKLSMLLEKSTDEIQFSSLRKYTIKGFRISNIGYSVEKDVPLDPDAIRILCPPMYKIEIIREGEAWITGYFMAKGLIVTKAFIKCERL